MKQEKQEELVKLVKKLIEVRDSLEPNTVKDIIQTLVAVSNEEFPLFSNISECKSDGYAKTDALFYALSSILSRHLKNTEILKAATDGMMYAVEHKQEKRNNTLCIAATGGEISLRTLYVTIPVGIICSLHVPTVVQGNRAVTGCGCGGYAESDMMEHLQYPLYLPIDQAEKVLKENNFYYAHAQTYHPILRRFARERGIIGFRDIFKIATGLSDPFRCEYQYLCVWASDLLEPTVKVFNTQHHVRRAVVTSGENIGYDEFPVTGGSFLVSEYNRNFQKDITLLDESILKHLGPKEKIEEETESIKKILDPECNEKEILEKRKLIVSNTALALWTVKNEKLTDLIHKVKENIEYGKALEKYYSILNSTKCFMESIRE